MRRFNQNVKPVTIWPNVLTITPGIRKMEPLDIRRALTAICRQPVLVGGISGNTIGGRIPLLIGVVAVFAVTTRAPLTDSGRARLED